MKLLRYWRIIFAQILVRGIEFSLRLTETTVDKVGNVGFLRSRKALPSRAA